MLLIFQVYESRKKELTKLDRKIAERILTHIYLLADNPYPPNAKQLVGMEHSFRLRVGDWRIIYTVKNEKTRRSAKDLFVKKVRLRWASGGHPGVSKSRMALNTAQSNRVPAAQMIALPIRLRRRCECHRSTMTRRNASSREPVCLTW